MHCIETNETSAEHAPSAVQADGAQVDTVVLRNTHGLVATITCQGAALAGMWVPDRNGVLADVVLGHGDVARRVDRRDFMGVSVGRVAGRIPRARFALDGREFPLQPNADGACLHGGPRGFDTRAWTWISVDAHCARLRLISGDGDQGFPGTLVVDVEYRLEDTDTLRVEYAATCDRPTVVNLTHHPFWNLGGEGAGRIDGHSLTLPASSFAVLDASLMPTGEIRPVDGSVFDFRAPRLIGDGLHASHDAQVSLAGGYDHYWVLDGTAGDGMRLAARLHDPASGRVLELITDQPGLQFYSGNFLDGSVVGKSGTRHHAQHGLCLEPQAFPDAVNRPQFPSIRLDPGDTYRNRIAYRFHAHSATQRHSTGSTA